MRGGGNLSWEGVVVWSVWGKISFEPIKMRVEECYGINNATVSKFRRSRIKIDMFYIKCRLCVI